MRLEHVLITACCLMSAGCSFRVTTDEGFDQDQARETLGEALEAWKDGKAKLLIRLSPPIRFVDDDYSAGFRLLDYEFDQVSQPIRPLRSVPVRLTLQRGNSDPITRQAEYQISLDPMRAVLRSDP